MRVLVGALVFTCVGTLGGIAIGALGIPKSPAVADLELAFLRYVGPILGGSVGGTLGLIFGGGWIAMRADRRHQQPAGLAADGRS